MRFGSPRPLGWIALCVLGALSLILLCALALGLAPLAASKPLAARLALFGIAGVVGVYGGVNACGSWLAVPWWPLMFPRNHPHFGGTLAVLRHLALVMLWGSAVGASTLVVFLAVMSLAQYAGSHVLRALGIVVAVPLENLADVPGGRALIAFTIAVVICRSTARVEMAAAIAKGEQRQHHDGTEYSDDDAKLTGAVNRLPYARFAVGFLVPIYRELRAFTGNMEIAAFRLLLQQFTYEQLISAAEGVAKHPRYRRYHSILEMRAELAAVKGAPEKRQQLKTAIVVSALNIAFGYYQARNTITAFCRRRSLRREDLDDPNLGFAQCQTHGDIPLQVVDYCVDAQGLKMSISRCQCLSLQTEVQVSLGDSVICAAIKHSEPIGSDMMHVGVHFRQADLPLVRSRLRRAGASV